MDIVLTLHDSSFPLAQCTGFGKGILLGLTVSVIDACFESEDTFDEVHNLDKTPLEGSCDMIMHEESPSLVVVMFSLIPLIIPMFRLCVHNPLFSLSITLMHPLIILRFVILMLTWAMRLKCLICLVEMLIMFFS